MKDCSASRPFARPILAAVIVETLATCAPAPRGVDVISKPTRSYFMGFSVQPPRPDINIAVKALDIWTRRADAAIMHVDVPWAQMLAGGSPEDALRKDGVDLEKF